MRIGIRFGDNDFYNTWHGVLILLKEALDWREDEIHIFDKQRILNIINEISYGCYLAFQHRKGEPIAREYLRIENIYLDKEVDEYLRTHDDLAEFYILDTLIYRYNVKGEIYTIR